MLFLVMTHYMHHHKMFQDDLGFIFLNVKHYFMQLKQRAQVNSLIGPQYGCFAWQR